MRVATRRQLRLDSTPVNQVQLNTQCRHEIVPFLRALQHIYGNPKLREELLQLVAKDVNGESSANRGREGMTYWQILVLAAARLELNLDYDGLQDLAENHRNTACGRSSRLPCCWRRWSGRAAGVSTCTCSRR